MMKISSLKPWLSCLAITFVGVCGAAQASTATVSASWKIIVLSDIHVNTRWDDDGRGFEALVPCLARLNPQLVVITGDSTTGNKNDGRSQKQVARWWQRLKRSLAPLTDANVPVLPVAGNHDAYTEAQLRAYQAAWPDLATSSGFKISGEPPFYYSTEVDGVHLSFAHIVSYSVPRHVKEWLENDLASAQQAKHRFVFGHVPLRSVMAPPNSRHRQKHETELATLMAKQKVDAYVCGHEHLAWDESIATSSGPVRQILVGTASATYNYAPHPSKSKIHCNTRQRECVMPSTGRRFAVRPGPRKKGSERLFQALRQTFSIIEIDHNGYTVSYKGFRPPAADVTDFTSECKGEIVPFDF